MSDLLFKLLAAGALLGTVYAWHRAEVRDEVERINTKAAEQRRAEVAEFVVDMSARNLKQREAADAEKRALQESTKTLVEKVPVYVSKTADSRCVVPVGFVHHYGAAWGVSAIPDAAGQSLDADSGVPLSRVESVTTENAGICREARAESAAWRAWYRVEKSKHDAFARSTVDQPQKLSNPAR
jgi:hypothetical protein